MFQAGAARTDITPRQLGYWFGGYLPRRRAVAIHQRLTATAAVLEVQGKPLVLLSLDLLSFRQVFVRELRKRISAATGLAAEQVWVAATHTHSGPDLLGLFGGPPAGYVEDLMGRCVAAVREAWQSRQPATLRRGAGDLSDLVNNRREEGQPVHDGVLAVLQAVDKRGRVIFTMVNGSCHPVAFGKPSTWVSPDWPGAMRDALEENLGGLSLFFNRAHGDVNPKKELLGGQSGVTEPPLVEAFGRLMADRVMTVKLKDCTPGSMALQRFEKNVLVTRPGMTVLGHAGFGEMSFPNHLRAEWVAARLGDFGLVGVPGEPLGRVSVAMQKNNPDLAFLIALQGGYSGYLMTKDDEKPGAYEEKLFVGHELIEELLAVRV